MIASGLRALPTTTIHVPVTTGDKGRRDRLETGEADGAHTTHTKPPNNADPWHSQRDSNPCRHLERVVS